MQNGKLKLTIVGFGCEHFTLSSQFQTRPPLQQYISQIHNQSWRSGNFHHSAWVEGHTVGPGQYPQYTRAPQMVRRLWVARKHDNQRSRPMRTNHTRNYHSTPLVSWREEYCVSGVTIFSTFCEWSSIQYECQIERTFSMECKFFPNKKF